jgi:hypothetical protein
MKKMPHQPSCTRCNAKGNQLILWVYSQFDPSYGEWYQWIVGMCTKCGATYNEDALYANARRALEENGEVHG